jgi:hypothetical protein
MLSDVGGKARDVDNLVATSGEQRGRADRTAHRPHLQGVPELVHS